jgi:hypothetical protein
MRCLFSATRLAHISAINDPVVLATDTNPPACVITHDAFLGLNDKGIGKYDHYI